MPTSPIDSSERYKLQRLSFILKTCVFATGCAAIVTEYTLPTLASYLLGNSILQWCSRHRKIELFYPDGNSVRGVVEDNISDLDGQVVQFERVGFVRLEGNKAFFLHR